MRKLLLYISGLIFFAAAAGHGVRLAQGWDIIVAGRIVSMDVSLWAAVSLGGLAVLCLFNARRA